MLFLVPLFLVFLLFVQLLTMESLGEVLMTCLTALALASIMVNL